MSLPWWAGVGQSPTGRGQPNAIQKRSREPCSPSIQNGARARRPNPPPREPTPRRRCRGRELQRIYDAHAAQIYRFIYHKVGNREDAEDLTAQVFMKAAQSLDPQQDEPSQTAWLYQVARTTIADHWRVYYKGSVVSLDAMEEEYGHQEVAGRPVLWGSAPQQDDPAVHKVEAILGGLPENYRQVLTFRFLQGYSLKETAAAMNISEGNVKVLQYRAIQKAGNDEHATRWSMSPKYERLNRWIDQLQAQQHPELPPLDDPAEAELFMPRASGWASGPAPTSPTRPSWPTCAAVGAEAPPGGGDGTPRRNPGSPVLTRAGPGLLSAAPPRRAQRAGTAGRGSGY